MTNPSSYPIVPHSGKSNQQDFANNTIVMMIVEFRALSKVMEHFLGSVNDRFPLRSPTSNLSKPHNHIRKLKVIEDSLGDAVVSDRVDYFRFPSQLLFNCDGLIKTKCLAIVNKICPKYM
ncbi:hypothetical protein GWI33_000652 [Rhynchophorus ferrugineus]|uniref:Uncharacterized protein n=1 Tax=Rhynchophorus ferrugineus TaxID=354439 RepID=A0A834MIB6_RHYFE|nr:hypothetical protein GWI33_000652 [Rhynchophorus ferrugineus]